MEKGQGSPRQRLSVLARVTSVVSRLLIWYTIITILFRCPSSPLEILESTPWVCKPYFGARSFLDPHIRPYYDAYGAPYVDPLRPYVATFYTRVYDPASSVAVDNYRKYGAPRVAQAIQYGEDTWEMALKPRLREVNAKFADGYVTTLAPYVDRATGAASPYFQRAKGAVVYQYRTVLVPSYEVALPYAVNSFNHSRDFVVYIGIPYTRWTLETVSSFLKRRVWPPLRIVYGRNVEPQLSKIRERLGSYRDSKKLEAVIDEENSSTRSDFATHVPPEPPMQASSVENPAPANGGSNPAMTESEPTPEANGKLTDELKKWKEKFAKASDKGAEDLSHRVADITARQIETQVRGVGQALVTELENESDRAIDRLRNAIVDAVENLRDDAGDAEKSEAYSEVQKAIRSAGATIKDKAQAIRQWRRKYEEETTALVYAALDSTLEVIDSIRDLGLSSIGQRWASMDGVTYQDWSEYHTLKKTFDEWRVQVNDVALQHDGLSDAAREGDDIEAIGMGIAKDVAAELARLKDVAKWKIHELDASPDFDTRTLTTEAAKIGEKVRDAASAAKEAVLGQSRTQGMAESVVSEASERASSVASDASSAVAESASAPPVTAIEELLDQQSMIERITSAVRQQEVDQDSQHDRVSDGAPPLVDSITEIQSSLRQTASEVVSETIKPGMDSAASSASEASESLLTKASSFASSLTDSSAPHASLVSELSEAAPEIRSKVDEIISRAGRSAGPKARSILSSIEEQKLADISSSASSAASSVSKSAASAADDAIMVGEDATKFAAETINSVLGAMSSASSVASATGIDYAHTISQKVATAASAIEDKLDTASETVLGDSHSTIFL